MATYERVQAIFTAEDRVSGPLGEMGRAAEEAAGGFDIADVAGDALEHTLSGLGRTAAEEVPQLDAAAASAAALGANAGVTAGEVEGLDAALSDLDTSSVAGLDTLAEDRTADVDVRAAVDEASVAAARTAIDTLPDDHTVDVQASVNEASFVAARTAAEGLPSEHAVGVRAAINEASFAAADAETGALAHDRTIPFRAGGVDFSGMAADLPGTQPLPFEATGDMAPPGTPGTQAVGVRAAVDEASFAAARTAVATLPDEHTVDVRANVDHPSFVVPDVTARRPMVSAETRSAIADVTATAPEVTPETHDTTVGVRAALDETAATEVAAALDALAHTRTATITPETRDVDIPVSADVPTISPETRAAIADVTASTPEVTPVTHDTTAGVSAAVDEASFAAVASTAESVPGEESVDYAATTDIPSFMAAEGYADALSDDELVDYRAAIGAASFAAAHESADALPDDESVAYRAATDAASFTAADTHAAALAGDEEVAYRAAVDEASFAAVETTTAGLLTEEDVAVEPDADMGRFAAVRAGIADVLAPADVAIDPDADMGRFAAARAAIAGVVGETETVPVEMDVDEASVAGAAAAMEAIPHERDVRVKADVDEASVAATNAELAGIGGGATAGILGIRSGIGGIAALAAAALPIVLSLGTALGGVAAGGTAIAGVFGGGILGGFLGQAQDLVGTTQMVNGELKTVENTTEGLQVVLGGFKQAAMDALQPLTTPIFQNLATDVLQGAVRLLGDFASTAADTYQAIRPIVSVAEQAFWDNEPRFFTAMEHAAVELAGPLSRLAVWLAREIPSAINFMTSQTTDLLPALAGFLGAVVDIVPPLTRLGTTVLQVALPALSGLLRVVTPVVELFNSLPGPVKQAGIVLAGAAAGAWLLGNALAYDATAAALVGDEAWLMASGLDAAAAAAAIDQAEFSLLGAASAVMAGEMGVAEAAALGLDAALAVLTSPLTIILALAAGAYLLADHFNLVGDVISGLGTIWNGFLSFIAGTANVLYNVADALGVFDVLGATVSAVGGLLQWAAGGALDAWSGFVSFLGGALDMVGGWLTSFVNTGVGAINTLLEAYNAIPGHKDVELVGKVDFSGGGDLGDLTQGPVDLSGYNVGQASTKKGRRGRRRGERGPGPGMAPQAGDTNYAGDTNISNYNTEVHIHGGNKSAARQSRDIQRVFEDMEARKRQRSSGGY